MYTICFHRKEIGFKSGEINCTPFAFGWALATAHADEENRADLLGHQGVRLPSPDREGCQGGAVWVDSPGIGEKHSIENAGSRDLSKSPRRRVARGSEERWHILIPFSIPAFPNPTPFPLNNAETETGKGFFPSIFVRFHPKCIVYLHVCKRMEGKKRESYCTPPL